VLHAVGAALALLLAGAESRLPHPDLAIERALALLGGTIDHVRVVTMMEIREIYGRTAGAHAPPAGLNAFRLPDDSIIYVNGESRLYRKAASKPTVNTDIRLAATLLHEQVHSSDGESVACRVQADFVRSRLRSAPARDRDELERYFRTLEARAVLLARAERRSRN
jgi:hypothetical protein